jgi:hypothetical protein
MLPKVSESLLWLKYPLILLRVPCDARTCEDLEREGVNVGMLIE